MSFADDELKRQAIRDRIINLESAWERRYKKRRII